MDSVYIFDTPLELTLNKELEINWLKLYFPMDHWPQGYIYPKPR